MWPEANVIASVMALVILQCPTLSTQLVRMCVYRAASRNRTTEAKFEIHDIDFTICTHYIYAYGRVDESSKIIRPQDPAVEEGLEGHYRAFTDGRRTAPGMNALLSVGGPSLESQNVLMYMDDTELEIFATSAVIFLRNRQFDGLDFDWVLADNVFNRNTLTRVLKVVRAEFDRDPITPHLLLTVTGSGFSNDVDRGFDPQIMQTYLDYLMVKSYGLYRTHMSVAHFSSPLYQPRHSQVDSKLNVNFSIHYWKRQGMPYKKIVVGITGVGRILELRQVSLNGTGAPITDKVLQGHIYQIPSGIAYPEVCLMVDSSKHRFDHVCKNPYLVKDTTWVGYENEESLKEKLAWIQRHGMAGIMFAGLDEDDFSGLFCESGKYPLLSYIKRRMEETQPTPPSITPVTTQSKSNNKDSDSSLETTTLITIICLFFFGFAIGFALLMIYRKCR